MSTARRTSGSAVAAALLAAVALAGCSGSFGGTGGTGSGPGAAPAGAASAVAKALGAGSSIMDTSKKGCGAIKATDTQALLKSPSAMTVNPFECDWNSGGLTVTIYPNDTNAKIYGDQTSNLQPAGSGSLSVGDKAVWAQPVPGRTIPEIVSRKGDTTCQVQVSADPPDTTISFSGKDPFFTITPADAAAYATKLGTLCSEVLSALG